MSCNIPTTLRLQTLEILARIVNWAGLPIQISDVNAITYSAFILHQATGEETDVAGFQNVSLFPVSAYISNSLIDDVKWDEDDIGYNFHFIPSAGIFTERGQLYGIRVTIDPTNSADPNLLAVFFIEVE
jgi:hypothetical protein